MSSGGTELFAPAIEVMLDDGTGWTVQTGNPDLVAWDMTAAKHKWPPVKDAPFLWLTFLAWHGSRRRGLLPDPAMTWETFRARAENIVGPDDDDDKDPTGTGTDDDGDPLGAGMRVFDRGGPVPGPD